HTHNDTNATHIKPPVLTPTYARQQCHASTPVSLSVLLRRPPPSTLFPYTTLFRSVRQIKELPGFRYITVLTHGGFLTEAKIEELDRKSTRLNSSHRTISYAVFCLKKKKNNEDSNAQPNVLVALASTTHYVVDGIDI